MKDPVSLTQDSILEQEYQYIRETATQAVDDRYKMLNFYVGLFTAMITVLISIYTFGGGVTQLEVKLIVGLLFLVTSLTGIVFLGMIIRLRQAWHESIAAMNKIKQYYVKYSDNELNQAFSWNLDTLPKPERFWNIHFYIAILIAIISSISGGLGTYFFASIYNEFRAALTLAIILGFVTFLLLLLGYRFFLKFNI